MNLKRPIVLLVDLDTFVVLIAKCFSDTLGLNGVGTPVLELESALDIMLKVIEQVVEGFGLSCTVINLGSVGIDASAVLLLRGS